MSSIDIKSKMRSVEATVRVTTATMGIARAHLVKNRRAFTNSQVASKAMHQAMLHTYQNSEHEHPMFSSQKEFDRELVILVGSLRGLCGGFNHLLMMNYINHHQENSMIWCIGKKIADLYNMRIAQQYEILDINSKSDLMSEARLIACSALQKFNDGEIDSCKIVYNKFTSVISHTPCNMRLLPIMRVKKKKNSESECKNLLPHIIRHLTWKVYSILLESKASECAARVVAMDNASNNARDMLKSLNLLYNRMRQNKITQELIEIVNGASAI